MLQSEHITGGQHHSGRLVETPRSLCVRDNGGGVCIAADDVAPGWILRSPRAQVSSQ